MKSLLLATITYSLCIMACTTQRSPPIEKETVTIMDSLDLSLDIIDTDLIAINTLSDTAFIQLTKLSNQFTLDLKYATADNFLKEKVYPCAKCLIRNVVAKALIKANDSLQQMGLHLVLFDCYRPLDVQKKMWKIFPNSGYVADPAYGSVHNRGAAVDIGLMDENKVPLDMGTPFDYFGVEAHHTFAQLPADILQNRKLLKGVMEHFGFKSIKTEWWHYNFGDNKGFQVSNFQLDCDQ